jgi:hypothetical protein
MDRKQMIARIKATTKGFRGVVTPGEVVKVDTDSLAFKVGKLLADSGHNKALAEVFGMITDLDVVSRFNDTVKARQNGGTAPVPVLKFFKPLVCVVPVLTYGGHNYPVKHAIVLSALGNGIGYLPTGVAGNQLNSGKANEIRLATDEEIETLTDAQVKSIIAEYTA